MVTGRATMATEVKLPRLGQGMESGTIVRWLKAVGETVEKGEPLYELDTEKVTQEVEAEASGVLLEIAVEEGEVEVGHTVAVIGEQGEDIPAISDAAAPAMVREEPAEPVREPEASVEAPTNGGRQVNTSGARVKASPLARRIARERGIDLAQVRGTGPDGRIVAEDVERAEHAPAPAPAAAPVPAGEVEEIPLTSVRKTIARRLTEAWQAPVFQLRVSADMTAVNEVRARLVEAGIDPKPTVSDVLTKLVAVALLRHRELNAHFLGESIRRFPTANVGLAVAAPQGLVVPVIRSAERLTLAEIAQARSDLVTRARGNKLRREDLEDGTFTISNLGMFGIEEFTAVLNPPQAAILAVGAADPRPVAVDDGYDVLIRPMMSMTLTCDHRAIDGADGAQFLRTLKSFLELPGLAL
jgi:pyruvate dehydrogenase E2 component (dihydrolipoamide acetyltransferase)